MVVSLWTIDATRAGMEEGTMASLPPTGWYPNPSGIFESENPLIAPFN